MTGPVFKQDKQSEFWIRERCFIREIVNSEEVPEFSLCETRVESGVTTELHSLDVKEWYIMLHGTGLMEVDGKPGIEVGPGDIVEIPAGVAQRITNTGTTDLLLQCVCLPRFRPDGYQALEGESGEFHQEADV